MAKSTAVINPNLGLYLDRSPLGVPAGGLQDGNNFRIQQGKLNNTNLGWSRFAGFTLNGAVTLITTLHLRSGSDVLMFGSPTDLYAYSTGGGGTVAYITPIYNTGTASTSGTAVTGIGSAWNTGTPKNAEAGDEISFGSNAVVSPAATWYTILSVNNDLSLTLTASAGVIAAGTYTLRQKFHGVVSFPWQFDTFINAQPASEDRIYLTNSIDPPVRWNGVTAQATVLNSLGITCKTLLVYKNMLLYGNIVQAGTYKPTDFLNSDISSPEVLAAGLAGQFKISGTADEIVRMAKLGDYLVFYLKRMVIITNFVGAPLVFVFRVAVESKGIQSPRAVATYPNMHEFLGADTLYAFDGSTAKPVGTHVWREIIRTMDPARQSLTYTILDEHRGDYIWAVALANDAGAGSVTTPPANAYVKHYLEVVPQGVELPYSRRSMPFVTSGTYQRQSTLSWDQLTAAWSSYNFQWNDQFLAASFPSTLVGDTAGKVWELNGSQNAADTGALPSFVTFGRRPLFDGENRGLLARVLPFVSPYNNPLTVTVSLTDFAAGSASIVVSASYDQNLPEGLFFAPIYRVGRYVDIQFGSDGPSQPYELAGYDIRVKPGSTR